MYAGKSATSRGMIRDVRATSVAHLLQAKLSSTSAPIQLPFQLLFRAGRLLLLTRRKSEVKVVSLESPTIWGSSLLSQQVHLPKYKYSRQIAERNYAPPLVNANNNNSSFISVIAYACSEDLRLNADNPGWSPRLLNRHMHTKR